MNRTERQSLNELYCGILANFPEFRKGKKAKIVYDFHCPEYSELIERYHIDQIAGTGGDFARAKRLLRYLAPRLHHEMFYDNHVACNALALLDYSLDEPRHGINCLNKSRILAECCLALGIPARRVVIMPFSPYDLDNHVVTEIYDRELEKWIMLDPTTNGYFADEHETPLSMLEIRQCFAARRFATYVTGRSKAALEKQRERFAQQNNYICKNAFYFILEAYNGFGQRGEWLLFLPEGYSRVRNEKLNLEYRLQNLPEEVLDRRRETLEAALERLKDASDNPTDIAVYLNAPA